MSSSFHHRNPRGGSDGGGILPIVIESGKCHLRETSPKNQNHREMEDIYADEFYLIRLMNLYCLIVAIARKIRRGQKG